MSKATVIGGSLTGLVAGILMRNSGWDVQLVERTPNRLADRGAGIAMQAATRELLRLLGGARHVGGRADDVPETAEAGRLAKGGAETKDLNQALQQWQARELARYGQEMGDRSQSPGNLNDTFCLSF